MIKIYLLFLLFLLISCGKMVTDSGDEDPREEETSTDGTYKAFLIPVNERITSGIHGGVQVRKYGDSFQVDVRLQGAPKGQYRQYLHTGSWCPQMNSDINGDGYLDGYEARQEAGYIIVPFDGDLTTQVGGGSFVLQGNYSYQRTTSYYQMLYDLHLPDDIVNDPMIKLDSRDLLLEKRTVMVYAVRSNLPSTVTGSEIPVACGILTRTSEYPSPDDGWETDSTHSPDPGPRPHPRPHPHPDPTPTPTPQPHPTPAPREDSWWDWIRNRWNEWRYGGGN